MAGVLGNCACVRKENASDRRQRPKRAACRARKCNAPDTSSPTISATPVESPFEDDVRPIDLTEVVCGTASGSTRQQIATEVVEALRTTGCLVVRDPRVPLDRNDAFLDLMEDYFSLPYDQKMKDCRPETSYQCGVTPSGTEVPRVISDATLQQRMESYAEEHHATPPSKADVKWRYFWPVQTHGTRQLGLKPALQQVIPEGMPRWEEIMNGWGSSMLDTVETVSELLALGYNLPMMAFSSLLTHGRHLLAPTGTDLEQHGAEGTVFAGYHYDLNFLTIHGKSRYPGLRVWRHDGTRVSVRIPAGCLLLQAGKQLAWLTGGDIQEGMHEVVCTQDTSAAIAKAREQGARPLWRASSTVFAHVGPEVVLRPIAGNVGAEEYPALRTGEYVRQELLHINLGAKLT